MQVRGKSLLLWRTQGGRLSPWFRRLPVLPPGNLDRPSRQLQASSAHASFALANSVRPRLRPRFVSARVGDEQLPACLLRPPSSSPPPPPQPWPRPHTLSTWHTDRRQRLNLPLGRITWLGGDLDIDNPKLRANDSSQSLHQCSVGYQPWHMSDLATKAYLCKRNQEHK
jgi:hypothetical protein